MLCVQLHFSKLYDGNTIWLDKNEVDPSRRYKGAFVDEDNKYAAYTLEASPDGVHWQRIVNKTGPIQDCSRVFFNPFRKKWVFSIKTGGSLGRQRAYWERDDLFHGPGWGGSVVPFPWPTVDYDDAADPLAPQLPSGQKLPGHQYYPQVYTVDAIAVESLMIGMFVIIECDDGGKGCDHMSDHEMDEVYVAFSRDGFSWSRPPAPRTPLAAMNTTHTSNWNWFDVQAAAGGFITMPDKLLMYVSGRNFQGCNITTGGCQHDSTGVASIRRDGFASLDHSPHLDPASLTTRSLVWAVHATHVFVNFAGTNLTAALIDAVTGTAAHRVAQGLTQSLWNCYCWIVFD